jgi:phosphopentomutase
LEKRAILIVLDGCGAGEAPDAQAFGDFDHPSTIAHVWEHAKGINAPNLARLGFFAACGIPNTEHPEARYGRLRELSQGKDSVTGHWELMGIVTPTAFPTYPKGFPDDLIKRYQEAIGVEVIGNCASSGTEIIKNLGPEHIRTGKPILYTSADSVFQVACHESVVPIDRLYEMCRIARDLCVAPNDVQRVIARPFDGDEVTGFRRTERRKDFPLEAPPNLIDQIGDVYGVGVVPELFNNRGFRAVPRTQSNAEHAKALAQALESDARLIFANFEDFDMLFGHRNDPAGFANAIVEFDVTLGHILSSLRESDLLILTADHGNDPTSASTDHSREYVPVVLTGQDVSPLSLGDVAGMTAVGATVAAWLGVDWPIGQNLVQK